jgi:dolichol-phosphate mannosyltransferase
MPRTVDHIAVVLPAFNEEKDLPQLLQNLGSSLEKLRRPYHIVVVDDGSADRTAAIAADAARTMPVHLVCHPRNMGLGRAIQTGLTEARKFGGIVVTMDADNSHDPAYISDMIAQFESNKAVDLVICSRYQRGSKIMGLSSFRRMLSYGCYLTMKSLLPYRNVRDYSTGFRAYDAAIIDRLVMRFGDRLVEQSGFACMLELIAKLRTVGAKVIEIPYTLRYDQKQGASKLRIMRTLKQYYHVVRQYAWRPVEHTFPATVAVPATVKTRDAVLQAARP